jgi:23S rRNA (pseudouridine1915-N3)-methyltransferase
MKITLLCVGKTRERFIQEGIAKYLKYLKPYVDLQVRELREEKVADLRDAPLVRKREADKILKALPAAGYRIALDERGRQLTSYEFAQFLNDRLESGVREAVFVIGGSLGLDETVTDGASAVMAMSRWTLTHEMARVVFLEQLYRAFTIIKGRPYHY